jgi:hypothetical protein
MQAEAFLEFLLLGYDGGMEVKRCLTARLIAGAIALGGTPLALLLGVTSFLAENPAKGLIFQLLLSPGYFAYIALICTALGKRFSGDPFTTWIPTILVNGFWLALLGSDTRFDESVTFG